jgi:hypothetical protein
VQPRPTAEVSTSIAIRVYPTQGTDIKRLTRSTGNATYRAEQSSKNTDRFVPQATHGLLRTCDAETDVDAVVDCSL